MGRTHGVHAEPITFGFKLLLWVEEMRRNVTAPGARPARTIGVGKISGAVGTHANVPPEVEEHVCAALGLAVDPVSSQIVQRDRHAQLLCTLAVVGSSLDKFATEIRHLQRTEVLEAEEPFETGRQGSSSMPHKRNPARCERVSGLARVLRGLRHRRAGERRPVARAGHLPLLSRARRPARTPASPWTTSSPVHRGDGRAARPAGEHAPQHGPLPGAVLLPARPAGPDRQGPGAHGGLQDRADPGHDRLDGGAGLPVPAGRRPAGAGAPLRGRAGRRSSTWATT